MTALINRGNPPKQNKYSDYRQFLRRDFFYSCAYCTITEIESQGLAFEIDHYYPQNNFPDLKNCYENLMYSCHECNRIKGGFHPTAKFQAKGLYIIRIDSEDPRHHYTIADNGFSLAHSTYCGEFNIFRLDLNKMRLRILRKLRKAFSSNRDYLAQGFRFLNRQKIDEIPPDMRSHFIQIKKKLENTYKTHNEVIDQFITDRCRSPFLEEDIERPERTKKIRKYLKELSALTP